MEAITPRDREILRNLAKEQLEAAHSPKNAAILKKWQAQAEGRRESPTVRPAVLQFYPRSHHAPNAVFREKRPGAGSRPFEHHDRPGAV